MVENEKFKKFIIKETLNAVEVNSSIDSWARSLGINLRQNQLEIMEAILNPSIRNIVILASRSGGKTFTVSVAAIKQCIENKGYRIVLLGPKADLAARIIKDGIVPICKNNDILNAEIDWTTTTQKEVKFKNGSWVRALSANENTQVEGHHCLTGDALILMKDGFQKPISTIKIGDFVKTINYSNLEIEDKRVEALSIKESDDIYEVSFDVNGEMKTVKCTGNHKWITLNRDIVETKDLEEDDIILGFADESNK